MHIGESPVVCRLEYVSQFLGSAHCSLLCIHTVSPKTYQNKKMTLHTTVLAVFSSLTLSGVFFSHVHTHTHTEVSLSGLPLLFFDKPSHWCFDTSTQSQKLNKAENETKTCSRICNVSLEILKISSERENGLIQGVPTFELLIYSIWRVLCHFFTQSALLRVVGTTTILYLVFSFGAAFKKRQKLKNGKGHRGTVLIPNRWRR